MNQLISGQNWRANVSLERVRFIQTSDAEVEGRTAPARVETRRTHVKR